MAVSLRTGRGAPAKAAEIAGTEVLYRFVGDLDGDNLPEVTVVAENQAGDDVVALVEAFRGVDGRRSDLEQRARDPPQSAVTARGDGRSR